jgi:hypothetical protein
MASLFTISNTQYLCHSTDEYLKKMLHVYTMEYYSAINKNELMPFVGKLMELEIIGLSKIAQTEKDKYHKFSFICRI